MQIYRERTYQKIKIFFGLDFFLQFIMCNNLPSLCVLSPGHIRHTSTVRAVCGQFTAENRGDRRITLRVPQGVGLNRRGRAVENPWSWAVERFANMFANQSTVRDLPTDIC